MLAPTTLKNNESHKVSFDLSNSSPRESTSINGVDSQGVNQRIRPDNHESVYPKLKGCPGLTFYAQSETFLGKNKGRPP
jgi:hypothetical protein